MSLITCNNGESKINRLLNVSMKYSKISRTLSLFSGLMLIACGEEQVATRDYPVVYTKPVTEISQSGANLNAEILNTGTSGILDHGFVYGDKPHPTIDESERISLGESLEKGTFSTFANRNLTRDKKYYVKAYAITKNSNFVVYGVQVEFISLGSQG